MSDDDDGGVWRREDEDDAEPDTESKIVGFPSPPIEDCPIALLGFHGEYVVFAMPEGNIRTEKAADIGRKLKVDIFSRVEGAVFLNNWRDSDDKFQRDQAVRWFNNKCREAGFWDASRPQRGPGVWPGRLGDVVLHRGGELIVYPRDKTKQPIAISIAEALRDPDGPIYTLKAKRPKPDKPASAGDGQWARDQLDAWHFDAIGEDGLSGADVIAGWLGASMLGAVAPFRPHALLYALLGSGKTTLVYFCHAMLSALAGDVLDAFTPAGLQNDLGGMARPVLIDEAEATSNPQGLGVIEGALDLIRKMATGEGSVRKMGTIGGGSLTQTAVGAVLMAAVNPVKLGPADASRIAEARLLPLDMSPAPGSAFKPTDDDVITAATARAKDLAPAFLGRALANAHRYLADAALLKAAFKEQGETARSSDLAAALAAGRRLLTSDDALTPEEAAEEAQFWRGLLESRAAAETVSNPGRDAFAHLMNWPSGKHSHDRVVSIGELVDRYATGVASTEDKREFDVILGAMGLKVKFLPGADKFEHPHLLVAHNSPGLDRIFSNTVWRDHRRALLNLDALGEEYRTSPYRAQRFAVGINQRSIAIPLDPWLLGDPDKPRGPIDFESTPLPSQASRYPSRS